MSTADAVESPVHWAQPISGVGTSTTEAVESPVHRVRPVSEGGSSTADAGDAPAHWAQPSSRGASSAAVTVVSSEHWAQPTSGETSSAADTATPPVLDAVNGLGRVASRLTMASLPEDLPMTALTLPRHTSFLLERRVAAQLRPAGSTALLRRSK